MIVFRYHLKLKIFIVNNLAIVLRTIACYERLEVKCENNLKFNLATPDKVAIDRMS